ncbi:hypothetical protein [Anaerolentibacter hominis]|uniref:hypothetical protein n=1 Tax=Anaerolentibacter hominis TaxID=3079009 RepID=UPI0031B8B2A7
MAQKNIPEFGQLDMAQAEQTLAQVFQACNRVPNTTPLSTLQAEGRHTIRLFTLTQHLAILGLILTLILPVFMVKPQLFIDTPFYRNNQIVISFQATSLTPLKSVKAAIDQVSIPVHKSDRNSYHVFVEDTGTLSLEVTAYNNQTTFYSMEVEEPDFIYPQVTGSYRSGETIVISLADGTYPIDFGSIYAVTAEGDKILPLSADEASRKIVLPYPEERLNIFVADEQGNSIEGILTIK